MSCELFGNSSTCRGDVFERRGGGASRGLLELMHQLPCVDGVEKVYVPRGAIEDREREGVGPQRTEGRGGLLGVATILEGSHRKVDVGKVHRLVVGIVLGQTTREILCDRTVIGRGARVGFSCQALAELGGGATTGGSHGLLEHIVLGGGGDYGDCRVVLGRRPDHRRTPDVNILNAGGKVSPRPDCLLEGVEVDNDQVYGTYVVTLHLCFVLVIATHGKNTSVNLGVEGLDTTVKDLGGAGVTGNLGHLTSGLGELLCAPTGGENVNVEFLQEEANIFQPRLIENGDESSLNLSGHIGPRDGGMMTVRHSSLFLSMAERRQQIKTREIYKSTAFQLGRQATSFSTGGL
mmetsp:Transcript_44395/g.87742  ORF Transcript_44395/g.87742 Transcript_44395/m.87742 type:complete len:349 (-) Transcript_44395:17-1063(-)